MCWSKGKRCGLRNLGVTEKEMSLSLELEVAGVATKMEIPLKLQEEHFGEQMWPGAGEREGGWMDVTCRSHLGKCVWQDGALAVN